jgi:hypothetical protein
MGYLQPRQTHLGYKLHEECSLACIQLLQDIESPQG